MDIYSNMDVRLEVAKKIVELAGKHGGYAHGKFAWEVIISDK